MRKMELKRELYLFGISLATSQIGSDVFFKFVLPIVAYFASRVLWECFGERILKYFKNKTK